MSTTAAVCFAGDGFSHWSFCGVFAFFDACLGFGAGLLLGLVASLKVTLHFAINVVVSVDVSDLDEVDEEPDEELDDEEELSEVRAPLLVALSTDVRVLSRSLGAKSSSVSSWSWLQSECLNRRCHHDQLRCSMYMFSVSET